VILTRRAAVAHLVPEIALPLAIFTVEAVAVAYLEHRTTIFHTLAIPDTPLSLIGAAIGIFVSFRTGAAYDRWWEARKLWGGIVNASRTLARQTLAERDAAPGGRLDEFAKAMVLYQIAWCHALGRQLRGEDPLPAVASLLPAAMTETLRPVTNLAAQITFEQGRAAASAVRAAGLSTVAWLRVDQTLAELTSCQGGCERISKTPLPVQYDVFPEIFIMIYCAVLPVTLVDSLHWLLPLATVVISFAFLAANRIGKNLEDPFDGDAYDTPMTAIAESIETLLRRELGDRTEVVVTAARDGVLH